MIKHTTIFLLFFICILNSSCKTQEYKSSEADSCNLRHSMLSDIDAEILETTDTDRTQWISINPKQYIPFHLRKKLYSDSIEKFSETRIIPWFFRDSCFDTEGFERLMGYSFHAHQFSIRMYIINNVNDTCSLQLLIQQLERLPIGLCCYKSNLYSNVTTVDMLKDRLKVLQIQK